MDWSGWTLTGQLREYTLGAVLGDGVGGEGAVYRVVGDPGLAVKIYHQRTLERDRTHGGKLQRKLECMLNLGVTPWEGGELRVAWPVDIVFHGDEMAGYVMPMVSASGRLYDVWRSGAQDRAIRQYDWRKSAIVAMNLAGAVALLHRQGVVLGDMNQKNLMVNSEGQVTVVDADSCDLFCPQTGEHFPCQVGLAEVLAPELQTCGNLSDARVRFTVESDNFSLAIQIFRLLFNGFHPFNCVITDRQMPSNSGITEQSEIVNGNCPYVRPVPGRSVNSLSPEMSFLPGEIQALFVRAFDYTALTALEKARSRPTAEEWKKALARLCRGRFRRCSGDRRHFYPANNRRCPFCGARPASMAGPLAAAILAGAILFAVFTQPGQQLTGRAWELIQQGGAFLSQTLRPWGGEAAEEEPAVQETDSPWLLPSHQRLLTEADVSGMSRTEIQMAINELYARHGRTFSYESLSTYFEAQSWYEPDPDLTDQEVVAAMSEIERENLNFLVACRDR